MSKILKHDISIFIYALLSTFFFTFTVTDKNTLSLFSGSTPVVISSVFLIILFLAYKKIIQDLEIPESSNIFFLLLALIVATVFTLSSVTGVFYSANASLKTVITLKGMILPKLLLVLLGGFIFFCLMIKAIGNLSRLSDIRTPEKVRELFSFLFEKNCFIKSFICIGIMWIPHLIIRYPFSIPVDSEFSLLRYYGIHKYTSQHPIIYTQLLGRFSDLGESLGNPAIGLAVLAFIQVLCLLLVLAYTISTMEQFGLPRWWQFGTLIIFSAAPVFVGYASTLIIDVFYSAAILLLMNELAWYIFKTDSYKTSLKHPLLTVIAVLGMFFRQNGFHVVAVIILFTACREIYLVLHKKQTVRWAVLILAILTVPLCAGKLNTSWLYQKYDVEHMSTRAAFALPLQQTARYIIQHGDDLSDEELASIQAVVAYSPEEFAEHYTPLNYNGIKYGFNKNVSSKELSSFLRTWIKLFFRHPGTCISATLNQNYCLFSPLKTNSKYYVGVRKKITEIKDPDYTQVYEASFSHEHQKQTLKSYYMNFCNFPVIGLCVNQGVTDFLLLVVCLYALCRKNGKFLLLGLPLLLTLAVTFIGPTVLGHPRYTFPIVYSMPLFLGIFITSNAVHNDKKISAE